MVRIGRVVAPDDQRRSPRHRRLGPWRARRASARGLRALSADTMRPMDHKRVLDDVVAWATADPNIRLLVVTGSFARGDHDDLSDLDIELYVRETHSLLEESAWYERFGDVLVTEALENPGWHPTRLVYYVDGKIDFMVAPVLALAEGIAYDAASLVMVNKDAREKRLEPNVGVAPPSADEFRVCINWFYAAAIQYAKA